jgi:hypothetical protein
MGKKSRKLHITQAYSRLYYEDKLKAIINEHWLTHLKSHPEDASKKGSTLAFRNKIVKELYDAEPAEVKAEVKKRRDEGFSDGDDEDGDDDANVDKVEQKRKAKAVSFQRYATLLTTCSIFSPMSVHSAQDRLALTMTRMLEQVEKECGMVGMVLLGGPEPRQGGKVVVVRYESDFNRLSRTNHSTSYQSGKTPLGYDFSQSCSDWKRNIEGPFVTFINKVFSKL